MSGTYRAARSDAANRNPVFDPAATKAMALAFDQTCEILGLTDQSDARLTKVIANKIIDFAQSGERDPDQLCALTVDALTEENKQLP